jgi:hypothetical protein
MKIRLPKTIISLAAFAALIFLLLFGLWGVKPTTTTPSASLGHFRLSPFTKGLALYQKDKKFYYNFSPYDDYYINQDGEYKTLVTKEDIMEEKFQVELGQNQVEDKINYFSSLFKIYQPQISFQSKTQTIQYSGEVKESTLSVERKINGFPQISSAQAVGSTISFAPEDFVFDQNWQLFTEKASEDIFALERFTGIHLTPVLINEEGEALWQEIPGLSVYIYNPSLPGVIQIKAQTFQKIKINPTYHLLALEEVGGFNHDGVKGQMTIIFFNHLKEINFHD